MEFTISGVKIIVIPDDHSKFLDGFVDRLRNIILDITKDKLLNYREIRVKIISKPNISAPNYLVFTLLKRDTYSFDTWKVDLDSNFKIISITENYME